MARPLRIEYPGAVYHITSRGNARRKIFKRDRDREAFLKVLGSVNRRYNWMCHAYCLMDNHYHLIIETPEGNLSKGMRQLNGVYTQSYNRGNNKVGHIFQGRYKAILIQKESHLLEVCRYVVLNPVRARVINKPEEWKWSSYRATAGMEKSHFCLTRDWILGQFSGRRRQAKKRYKEFVESGAGEERIWKNVKGQSILGEDDFVESLIKHVKGYEEIKEIPKSQRYVSRPKLAEILSKRTVDKKKRNKYLHTAHIKYGYKLKEIADYLGIHYTTVSKAIKGEGVKN